MKRVAKWLLRIGVILIAIAILAAIAGVWFVRRAWPETTGTLQVAGLSAPVQILRDQWGIPQIYAQNDRDLFFAQGYVHAQDRLWQMEMNRRAANGVLSEILGERTLATDQFLRALGLRRMAEQNWTELDDNSRAILQAYADGVNAYMDTHRDRLPIEFTILGDNPAPWTPIDTLAWGNLVAFDETVSGYEEIQYSQIVAKVGAKAAQQLIPPYEDNTPIIAASPTNNPASQNIGTSVVNPPPNLSYQWLEHSTIARELGDLNEWLGNPEAGWGSNSWVVSGKLTATGKPLLANDTHIDLRMPSFWYQNGLHDGHFETVGFSFPGAPLVIVGHNQQIAWGLTVLRADDMDSYIEKLNDLKNPTQYQFQGQWRDLEFVTETINVKGQAPVTVKIPLTPDGPIVNADTWEQVSDDQPLALRWTLADGNQTFKSIVALNLAANWDQFRAALAMWDAPAQNFVYADMDGNIGYQAAGKLPIRVPGDNGRVIMPGWDGQYQWQGYIPFSQLPSSFNPPAGFIATANNKAVPDDYPYLISAIWNPGYRAMRIISLLTASNHLTAEDMQQIQGDTYSLPAKELLPYLLQVTPQNDLQAKALTTVKDWDLRHDTNSVGASIYETWFVFLIKNTIESKLGSPPPGEFAICVRPTGYIQSMADANNIWFPDVKTRDEMVSRSLADAVNWLGQHYGQNPDDWQWGRLHTLTFVHAPLGQSGIAPLVQLFNSRTIPAPGDNQSLNMSEYDCYNRMFQAYFGSSQRMIADLSNWDSLQAINSTGQSGQLFDSNREDQIPLWQNNQYLTFPFSRSVIEKNASAVLTLTPRP